MKLGIFIVVSLCAATMTTRADVDVAAKAIAHSRAHDYAGAIELYRKAYEERSDPRLLVRIAHEFRKAGDVREALAYFCSYMYVDAAGELADEASENARAISAQLGTPTQSDHEACSPRPPASREASVDLLGSVQQVPPRITKREIVGLAGLASSVAFLGLSLLEGSKLRDIHAEQGIKGADLDALAARESSADLRQKLFLAAGGVTLVTGGILYVLGRNDRRKAERTLVAPSLSKGSAGVAVGRRF